MDWCWEGVEGSLRYKDMMDLMTRTEETVNDFVFSETARIHCIAISINGLGCAMNASCFSGNDDENGKA